MKKISYLFLFLCLIAKANENESVRIDDSKINLEKKWLQCQKNFDCVEIHYGCDGISSANRKFYSEAQSKAYKEGGDSRAMNCEVPKQKFPKPIAYECRQGFCGAFQYPACEDTECTKPYPKCDFETKWSQEPNKFDIAGGSFRLLWGPTKKACQESCEDQILRLKARLTQPTQGHYRLECRFKNESIFKKFL